MDGFTQEIYSQYRVNGNLDILKSNLERLVSLRKQMKSKYPFIELQFIDFGFNSSEQQIVKDYACLLNIDRFTTFKSESDYKKAIKIEDSKILSNKEKISYGCFDIYAVMDIDSSGNVYTCDVCEDKGENSVGNILNQDINSIWNSEVMISNRRSFSKTSSSVYNKSCLRCYREHVIPKLLR